MKKRLKRRCHHCKQKFTADPYNAYQQEYCTLPGLSQGKPESQQQECALQVYLPEIGRFCFTN